VSKVASDASTTGINETDTVPETNVTITQGTGTILEFAQAVPYTRKMGVLSKWDPKNPIIQALRDDMAETIDKAVEAQFDACKIRNSYVTDTSKAEFTTDGTCDSTASVLFDDYQLKEIIDYMEHTMRAKPYDGNSYVCLATVQACRGLHDHLEQIWQYTKYPLSGEIGKYYNCRVVKEMNNAMDGTIGNSNVAGEAYVFGNDTVIEAVSEPERIVPKEVTDYQRSFGYSWQFMGGFKIVWEGDPSNTIVKVDSL
jgi:hypothetical protein